MKVSTISKGQCIGNSNSVGGLNLGSNGNLIGVGGGLVVGIMYK